MAPLPDWDTLPGVESCSRLPAVVLASKPIPPVPAFRMMFCPLIGPETSNAPVASKPGTAGAAAAKRSTPAVVTEPVPVTVRLRPASKLTLPSL